MASYRTITLPKEHLRNPLLLVCMCVQPCMQTANQVQVLQGLKVKFPFFVFVWPTKAFDSVYLRYVCLKMLTSSASCMTVWRLSFSPVVKPKSQSRWVPEKSKAQWSHQPSSPSSLEQCSIWQRPDSTEAYASPTGQMGRYSISTVSEPSEEPQPLLL